MIALPRGPRVLLVSASASCAILFSASMAACSGPLSESELRGKALYSANCYECHEESPPGLKKTPPRLHDIFSRRVLPDGTTPASDASLRHVILYGQRTMPAFNGRLNEQQIGDLIAYLHRI